MVQIKSTPCVQSFISQGHTDRDGVSRVGVRQKEHKSKCRASGCYKLNSDVIPQNRHVPLFLRSSEYEQTVCFVLDLFML